MSSVRCILRNAAALLCLGAGASGHDFWISPSTLTPTPGSLVGLTLKVGHAGHADRFPRDPEHLLRFWRVGPNGVTREIDGETGANPAGMMRSEQRGAHIAAYVSRGSRIELEPARFDQYLQEEGLESIAADRRARNESDAPGREFYSRSAKSILTVGGRSDGYGRVVGLPLELIPAEDPTIALRDGAVTLLALFDGRPLVDVQIDAASLHDTGAPIVARTNERGEATFQISETGPWLFAATHMRRAEAEDGVDWRSVWGSLTIHLGAGDPATGQ